MKNDGSVWQERVCHSIRGRGEIKCCEIIIDGITCRDLINFSFLFIVNLSHGKFCRATSPRLGRTMVRFHFPTPPSALNVL